MEGRVITVPLRKVWKQAPRWKRTSRAVKELKEVIKKNTRAKEVKIGRALNEKLWEHGGKSPPAKVKVVVIEEEDGQFYVDLSSVDIEERREARQEKKEEKVEEPEEEEEEMTAEEKLEEKYMRREPK